MNQPKLHTGYKPPGLLRHGVNPEVIMMICTAGHVDHGKTALVRLLTGCNTDRLKIEQERGLTIELGFAPCYLGNNLCVGIVDVPGHERFIKNMVAGVSGIEMAALVIAADDGIMPQTVEHLQIMELLGVRRGMVALTKIDLVSREQVERRIREIGEFLVGTFLEGATICPVSSETLEGYDHFYHTLVDSIKKITVARRRGVFRMPVERVFSRPGFGFVVSGIPVDGAIQVGDEV
ncbi:MAG: GTP-binding protein, partial [Candidatus Sumerlaeota bacterium]|nr:GTP-binding protein [Candidatus Sumerlaeota bacterium]